MPYSPKLWVLDDAITATDMNRIENGIADVSTDATALQTDVSALENRPSAQLWRTTALAVAQNTWVDLNFENSYWNAAGSGMIDPGDDTALTITKSGFYLLTSLVRSTYAASGTTATAFFVNDANFYGADAKGIGAFTPAAHTNSFCAVLTAGQTVGLRFFTSVANAEVSYAELSVAFLSD